VGRNDTLSIDQYQDLAFAFQIPLTLFPVSDTLSPNKPSMPRNTRAALRSQELAEESNTAASIPSAPTLLKERAPLGEITGDPVVNANMIDTEDNAVVIKKGPAKAKKGKGARKGKKQGKDTSEEPDIEVLDDGHESPISSAAEEASQDLLKDDIEG